MRVGFGLFFILLAQSSLSATKVVLDPGHGGSDYGAVVGRIRESQITLNVAKHVADLLRKDERFRVQLTRESDNFVGLEERASQANRWGDIFVSIHVNSSSDARARGEEIYFQNQLPTNEESLFLANRENSDVSSPSSVARSVSLALKNKSNLNSDVRAIVEDLERNHNFMLSGRLAEFLFKNWSGEKIIRRHTIRQAPFFVVSNVDKPAALIEIGYLTNAKESAQITDQKYQKTVAQGIYGALVQFKEFMDKSIPKSLD